jgi:hypothetical protein
MEAVALLQAMRDEQCKEREERSGMIAKIQARMEKEKERAGRGSLYVYGEKMREENECEGEAKREDCGTV